MRLYRPKMSVGLKTWVALSIIFWIPMFILAFTLFHLFGSLLRDEVFNSVKAQLKGAKSVYEERVKILEGVLEQHSARPDLQDAFARRDAARLREFLLEFGRNNPHVDVLTAVDERGVVLSRRGGASGDTFNIGETLSRSLTHGKTQSSTEIVGKDLLSREGEGMALRLRETGIVQFVVAPVRRGDGVVGAVVAGILLSGDPWLGNTVYGRFRVEMALFAGIPPDTAFLHSTSSLPRSAWMIGQPIDERIKDEISLGRPYYGIIDLFGARSLLAFEPVYNGRNVIIGAIGISSPARAIDSIVAGAIGRGVGLTAAITFVLAVAVTYMVHIDITRPLNFLVKAMESFGRGEMDIHVDLKTGDQFETLGRGLNAMAEGIRKREERLRKHNEVARLLMSTLDLKELLSRMLDIVVGVTESQMGIVYLYEEPNSMLVPHIQYGTKAALASMALGEGYPGKAAADLKTYIISPPDTLASEAMELGFAKAAPREVAYIPLAYQERLLGVLVLGTASGYSEEEVQLFGYLASQLSIALDNAIMHQRIQELSITDGLTGLYNRRYLNLRLEQEWARCSRHGTSLTVLLADVDNFKSVNDTYGHDKGDEVLKAIAKTFRGSLRKEDLISRYGGEEFVAVLADTGVDEAMRLVERFRELTARHVYEWMGRPVTLSVGVATYPDVKATDIHDLVKAADQAMYQAKVAGKDRVTVARGQA
jgi:diguanylate cyclase (GGDEF)-like protein